MNSSDKVFNKKVLDHGIVRLVDSMPNINSSENSFESAIVQMARVSYGTGTKSFREDIGLIKYLLENDHTSPFEGITLKFHLKMPIFVARQWVRHRTASLNEYSARYSVIKDSFYIPEPERLTGQSLINKQGSSDELIKDSEYVCNLIKKHSEDSYKLYEELLSKGLSRELSRMVIPVNVYTEMYWVISFHNLLKFLRLRMDEHAQYEIRVFAEAIYDIMHEICPNIMDIWKSSQIDFIKFTKEEIDAIEAKNIDKQIVINTDISEKEGWSRRRISQLIKKILRLSSK